MVEVFFDEECPVMTEFKLINHLFGLILLGGDALRAGKSNGRGWTFRAVGG